MHMVSWRRPSKAKALPNAGDLEMNEPLAIPSVSSQDEGSCSPFLHCTMSDTPQKACPRTRLHPGFNAFYGSLWPPAQELNQLYPAVLCLLSGPCLCSEPLPQPSFISHCCPILTWCPGHTDPLPALLILFIHLGLLA